MAAPKIEVVSCEPLSLGEGPIWDSRNNNLVVVDIKGHNIWRVNTVTGKQEKTPVVEDIGFAIPTVKSADRMVFASKKQLQFIDFSNSMSITNVAEEVEQELTGNNRFNDAKCDASGRLWAGTMGSESTPMSFQKNVSALYSLDADLTLRKQVEKVSISNGTIWSLDNSIMYYIDSLECSVDAFDFDLQNGILRNRRKVINFKQPSPTNNELPDGMTIDAEGKLWVAVFNGGKVIRFDPETAKELQTLKFPASKTTSCCFAGPGLQDMYVTSAHFGLSEANRKAEPKAGHTFKVTGLGVRGVPDHMFAG